MTSGKVVFLQCLFHQVGVGQIFSRSRSCFAMRASYEMPWDELHRITRAQAQPKAQPVVAMVVDGGGGGGETADQALDTFIRDAALEQLERGIEVPVAASGVWGPDAVAAPSNEVASPAPPAPPGDDGARADGCTLRVLRVEYWTTHIRRFSLRSPPRLLHL